MLLQETRIVTVRDVSEVVCNIGIYLTSSQKGKEKILCISTLALQSQTLKCYNRIPKPKLKIKKNEIKNIKKKYKIECFEHKKKQI